mmetsp:Transcript_6879/g.9624  ORF Transcript_6879/g.9624 Transcript_6879/m.9624 type:complete len:380 (-) Transcript_6879:49-1188(-)
MLVHEKVCYELKEISGGKKLVVEYGDWNLEWLVVMCDKEQILDVLPSFEGLPCNEDDVYEGYTLETSFGSLMNGTASVDVVAKEIRESFKRRQLELVRASDGLKKKLGDIVLQMVEVDEAWLKMKKDGSLDLLCRVPCDDKHFLEIIGVNSFTMVKISLNSDGSVRSSHVTHLPVHKMPLTSSAFIEPRCQEFAQVDNFLDACREKLLTPWRRRKELAQEIQKKYVLVDLDTIDFSRLTIILNIVQPPTPDFRKRLLGLFVVTFRFAVDFPEKPPTMSIRDFSANNTVGGQISSKDTLLDRIHYKYSPRWQVERMAQELVDHAAQSAINATNNSMTTNNRVGVGGTTLSEPSSSSSFVSNNLYPPHPRTAAANFSSLPL